MKNISTYFLTAFLFFSPLILPSASAQSWLWGRAGITEGCDAYPVATDPSGNVFCAGLRLPLSGSGSIDFGGSVTTPGAPGVYQSVWVKYDNSGTPLWADGTLSGDTWINSIATDGAGNLILFGSFNSATMQIGSFTLTNSYPAGTGQYYLAKVSPTGTVLWAIKDGNTISTYLTLFGPYLLGLGGVSTDNAGNIYITGSFDKPTMTIGSYTLTNSGAGTYDIYVAKYTPAGVLAWASSIGGTADDYGLGITVASTGDVYVCGGFSSPSITIGSSVISDIYTKPIAYIARFSSSGTPLWGQAAGGANGSFAIGLAKDNSGNVFMTGGVGDAAISFGGTTVTRTYPGAVPALALYLVEYSPANVVTWSKTIGSATGGAWGFCIAMAPCGQVWVSGNYTNDVNIDGSILAAIPGGPDPVFIAGYSIGGSVVNYSGLPSGGDDQNGIACDGNGNVFICADYQYYTMTIGPDVLPSPASPEAFYLGKYGAIADTSYTHQDTVLCATDSITLTAPAGYTHYYWNNSTTASTLKIGKIGTYQVFCITCGDTTISDTFHVSTAPYDTSYNHTDTSVCLNIGSAMLAGPAGYSSYSWNTGSAASSISVSTAGTYYVKAISECSLAVDTFHFTITPDDTTTTYNDTSVCSSIGSLILSAPASYNNYVWNTGSTLSSISVSSSSIYWVTDISNCSIQTDSLKIVFNPLPLVALGQDTVLCIGDTLTITSDQPVNTQYLWSTGSTSPSVKVTGTGIYKLTVSLNGCSAADSINISGQAMPSINLGPDSVLCSGEILQLSANGNTILWSNGTTGPTITVTETGIYWATVSNNCGNASDTINISYELCDIWFPNAFTPNGDGKNDIARVVGNFNFFTNFSLSIYNRYGQRVFYTQDIYEGWDGTFNGVKQDVNTYFYMIEYTLEGHRHMMKGDLELIR